MTPQEKVIECERQVRLMVAGQGDVFCCPFCGLSSSEENGMLCCNEAAEVVVAVLDHLEHIDRCTIVERTMDHLANMQASVLN